MTAVTVILQEEDIMRQTHYFHKAMVWLAAVSLAAMAFLAVWAHPAYAEGGLEMNTQYPGVSVKPGDSLSIPIAVSYTHLTLPTNSRV